MFTVACRGFPFLPLQPTTTTFPRDVRFPSPRICYCFTKQTQNRSHSSRRHRPRSHPSGARRDPRARVCNSKARVCQPRRWFRVFPKTWDCSPRCLCAVSVRLVQSSISSDFSNLRCLRALTNDCDCALFGAVRWVGYSFWEYLLHKEIL